MPTSDPSPASTDDDTGGHVFKAGHVIAEDDTAGHTIKVGHVIAEDDTQDDAEGHSASGRF